MKKIFIIILLTMPVLGFSQSKTIQKWHDRYTDAFVMFFYPSTLNMLNVDDSEEFDDVIKDIEKLKMITISKVDNKFTTEDYKELVSDYKSENFEDLMSFRQKETMINAYINEKDGKTKGLALLLNSDSTLTIIDLKGSIPLNKVGELAQQIQSFK